MRSVVHAAVLLIALPAPALAAVAGPGSGPEPRMERGAFTRRAPSGSLPDTVRSLSRETRGPFWMAYAAALVDGEHMMCCSGRFKGRSSGPARDEGCGGCRLEDEGGINLNHSDTGGGGRLEGDDRFLVLARVADGRVRKVRALSMDCALDSGALPLYWIGEMETGLSLAWLDGIATDRADAEDGPSSEAVMAIAMHRGAEADRLIGSYVERGRSSELREQAAFWAGVARGAAGSELLRRVLDDRDPRSSQEMRKKVIFALSQNEAPGSLDAILRAARSDDDADVRAEAIFWLAQKAGEKAAATLGDAIDDDPDIDVKKKAVFGLSQLPADEGVPRLIDVVRRHRSPDIRREALFWLGQSGDPRALAFIEEILNTELSSAPRSSTKVRM